MSEASLQELPRSIKDIKTRSESCIVEGDPAGNARRLTEATMQLNVGLVTAFGGKLGTERSTGMTEQIVSAPFQRFGDYDPYPEAFDKASMLLKGIATGHPFTDGNKRTALATSIFYLDQVGIPLPEVVPDELYDFTMRISTGELRDLEDIKQEFQGLMGYQDQPTEV